MLYGSLDGLCEYTTQPKGCFWCHFVDIKGTVLLLVLINELVLVHIILISVYVFLIFVLTKVSGRVKAALEPQECHKLGLDMGNFM